MKKSTPKNKISLYNRWLNGIEVIGNNLPHPIALFAIFAIAVVVLSAVFHALGISATGELVSNGTLQETTVKAVSLVSSQSVADILCEVLTITNFERKDYNEKKAINQMEFCAFENIYDTKLE